MKFTYVIGRVGKQQRRKIERRRLAADMTFVQKMAVSYIELWELLDNLSDQELAGRCLTCGRSDVHEPDCNFEQVMHRGLSVYRQLLDAGFGVEK